MVGHDDICDIELFYDKNVEMEDGRLERHPIERDATWRHFVELGNRSP